MAELKKYTHDVFKQKDLLEYLTNEQTKHYMEISYAIMQGRMAAGKNPENHYLVCNTDEPYADRVRKAILDGEDEKLEGNAPGRKEDMKMNYLKHLLANWKLALHGLVDFAEHFLHGLIPIIGWDHCREGKHCDYW